MPTGSVESAEILDGTISGADLASDANIALSKLATSTAGTMPVANDSGTLTAVALSGDAALSSAGALTIGTGAITSAKILDGTIGGGDLASNIAITTTSSITTTASGTITSAGTLTASNGFTLTSGTLSLPAGSVTNAMIASPNSYFVMQAHKTAVASLLTGQEIFEFTAPAALTLVSTQVYATAITSTATVDVQEAGVSVLSGAITPIVGSSVVGTISDTAIASGAAVTVNVTSNVTGAMTDLTVTLVFKAAHIN